MLNAFLDRVVSELAGRFQEVVSSEVFPGQFTADELRRASVNTPAFRLAAYELPTVVQDAGGEIDMVVGLSLVVITTDKNLLAGKKPGRERIGNHMVENITCLLAQGERFGLPRRISFEAGFRSELVRWRAVQAQGAALGSDLAANLASWPRKLDGRDHAQRAVRGDCPAHRCGPRAGLRKDGGPWCLVLSTRWKSLPGGSTICCGRVRSMPLTTMPPVCGLCPAAWSRPGCRG